MAQRSNFDADWRFALGHAADASADFRYMDGSFSALAKAGTDAGPIGLGFDDSAWRTLDLPHDWAIELPFDPKADGMHGFRALGRGFPQHSVGWYRKSFDISEADLSLRHRVTFDGIFRNAHVFLNGHWVGQNESGYIGFTVDLSDSLKAGRNVLAVRVDASFMEGWFYEGAGIYRHVWLTRSAPIYLEQDGAFFEVPDASGAVEVTADVRNETDAPVSRTLTVEIRDAEGTLVAMAEGAPVQLAPRSSTRVEARVQVEAPRRWDVDDPYLYSATARIADDQLTKNIGFREFRFDKDLGFFLNGRPLKIKGTCNHQDHAGVGSAVPDRLNAWRIAQLRKIGCNFYRTSHNPPTPELLDACDRLGMMVLDETRYFGSTGDALDQLVRFVRRDRNHPSVIFWSIGNEEWGTQESPESQRIAQTMIRTIRALDPTRPITYGANNGASTRGINEVVDIRGFNYNLGGLEEYRAARPDQPIHGSEVASTVTTRGVYVTDPERAYVNAYDINKIAWGSNAEDWWRITLERDWFAGGFVWTGFDYRGEPTPYSWPNINSHFGILDTCGFMKDVAWYYKTWWTDEPVLHLFPHWNWPGREGEIIDVWAFSNHEEVELLLDGRSLGRKVVERGGHVEWKVPYQPGALEARAYVGGACVQQTLVETTGSPARLELSTDTPIITADGADVAIVKVQVLDGQGRPHPTANNLVRFEVEGGRVLGVGNGDPSCHEPDTWPIVPRRVQATNWKWTSLRQGTSRYPGADRMGWLETDLTNAQLPAGKNLGAFAGKLEVPEDLEAAQLQVGPMDDHGWVYVDGQLVLTSDRWDQVHRLTIPKLNAGEHEVLVVVQNTGGQGGFTRGVSLELPPLQPSAQRSLFNGLAQVIVRAGKVPGKLMVRAFAEGLEPATLEVEME